MCEVISFQKVREECYERVQKQIENDYSISFDERVNLLINLQKEKLRFSQFYYSKTYYNRINQTFVNHFKRV